MPTDFEKAFGLGGSDPDEQAERIDRVSGIRHRGGGQHHHRGGKDRRKRSKPSIPRISGITGLLKLAIPLLFLFFVFRWVDTNIYDFAWIP